MKFVDDADTNENISDEYAKIPDDLCDRVTEILNKYDLRKYDPYSVLYDEDRADEGTEQGVLIRIG